MQNQADSYSDKVFDKEILNLTLNLMEMSETHPQQSLLVKRLVLDALTTHTDVRAVNVYLQNIQSLPVKVFLAEFETFVDICSWISRNKHTEFKFFEIIKDLQQKPGFKDWSGFFRSLKSCTEQEELQLDLIKTVRHLLQTENFSDWEVYFNSFRSIASKDVKALSDFQATVRRVIQYFKQSDSLATIFKTLVSHPAYNEATAYGQLESKQWLIDEALKVFGNDWGRVFVLAGWIGYLPRFIFDTKISVTGVRSFDLDPQVAAVAESLNQSFVQKEWIFKASTKDITKMSYPTQFTVHRKDGSAVDLFEMPEMIINTSCEHIEDIGAWLDQIPSGMRLILQSNDAFHIEGHVKCFKTLAEFEAAMNLSEVYYRGEKQLADFNRFMLIGRK